MSIARASRIPEHQEERGRDHKQHSLMQQLQNCCSGEYDEHSEELQSVSMDMELEVIEPAKHNWQRKGKTFHCLAKVEKAKQVIFFRV